MAPPRQVTVVRRFLDALCRGDAATVDALMTDDMVYVDGRGYRLDGHSACSAAARAFHKLEPNYRFEVLQASARGDTVLVRGRAHADDPRFEGEILVRAKVRGGFLCEYQVNRHNATPLAKILVSQPD